MKSHVNTKESWLYQTAGLFGLIKGGGVRNLNMEGVSIKGFWSGGIAALLNKGVIENCAVSGSVSGYQNGLVVGVMTDRRSAIKNCAACGDVTFGGIVGMFAEGSVTGCVFINSEDYPGKRLAGRGVYGLISNCFAGEAGVVRGAAKDAGCGTVYGYGIPYPYEDGVSILEIDDPLGGKDTAGLGGEWTFTPSYYPSPTGVAKSSLPAVRRIAALAAVPIFFNKSDLPPLVTGAFKVPMRTADGRELKWSVKGGMDSRNSVMLDTSGNVTFPTPVEDEIILIADDGQYKKNFIINVRVGESGASFVLDIGELGLSDKVARLERFSEKYDHYERFARVSGLAGDILCSFGESPEEAEKILGRPFYRTSKRKQDEIVFRFDPTGKIYKIESYWYLVE